MLWGPPSDRQTLKRGGASFGQIGQIPAHSEHPKVKRIDLTLWTLLLAREKQSMALSAVRRALGKRIDVQLPIVGYGGAGIMLGGKKPVTERAGIGELLSLRLVFE